MDISTDYPTFVIPDPPPGIPTPLFHELFMLMGSLEERGHVQCRRDHKVPSYRIRVVAFTHEGFRRCLSIPIPDDAVPAVRKLLSEWRASYRAKIEAIKAAKRAKVEAELARKRLVKLQAKEERKALREMIGGTEWRQRRLLREFDQVSKLGFIQSSLWLVSKQYARVDKPLTTKQREEEAQKPKVWENVDVQAMVRERIEKRRRELALE